MKDIVLRLDQVSKTYSSGNKMLTVLKDISFEVVKGTSISIIGPSGSGKTTLLGLCAGLDHPSFGTIELEKITLNNLNEDQRAQVRNQFVGFIFQNFQLMPTLTAIENVMVPMELRREKKIRPRAMELLGKVGLADRSDHYPVQLSGGEQQRISLARAFANHPEILFADEPTGNLDAETSKIVIDLLFELNKEAGTTLVVVTHDVDLASKTERTIRLKGGKMID